MLVGSKSDLASDRQVSFEEGKQLADKLGVTFYEVSALTGIHVDSVFTTLATCIKNNKMAAPGS